MIEYRTLTVRVQELQGDTYEAIVRGPAGDGRVRFEFQFELSDLDAVAAAVSHPRAARRRIETDESALARAFGQRLFDLVFQGSARDVMRASLSEARNDDEGLRLMLELEGAPKLRNVPWELLWDRPKFVSTSAYTPVVRYVDLPMRPRPLEIRPPLRILGMVSSPGDVAALDTEGERALLTEACGAMDEENLLEINWVEEASLRGLLERLDNGTYHIFHFIGHGDFEESSDDGVLLFEGRAGRSHRVTGTELGTILSDHHTLRLAVINACEGARVADDWGGIAGSLMQYGLPAVIAMQFEISDAAALSFARCLYPSIARSRPVDEALADARRGMFADGYGLEWATPVMFTSVGDGRLFDVNWDDVRASGARLELSLELDTNGEATDEVMWRLGFENVGELDLKDLQPRAEDGLPLCDPFALASGDHHTLSWAAPVDPDGEAVVTVTGVDGDGRAVSETVSAVPDRKLEPPPDEEGERPPPRRWALVGFGIAGVLVVVAIVVALSGGGTGVKAGIILKHVRVRDDSRSLVAGAGAVVAGPGGTVTAVGPDHVPMEWDFTRTNAPLERSVAITPGRIWVDSGPTTITSINPSTGHVLTTESDVTQGRHHLLGVGGGWLWVVVAGSNGTIEKRRLDGTLSAAPELAVPEATHLAVDDHYEYVLNKAGSSPYRSLDALNSEPRKVAPPAPGLSGTGIKTAAGYLYLQRGEYLVAVPSSPRSHARKFHIAAGIVSFDADDSWIWVTYTDGTLKRFERRSGRPVGSAIKLGGKGIKVAVGDAHHAWVLVDSTPKELLDVVPDH